MKTAKDTVRKLLDRLPDEATFEDIRYQIDFLNDVSRGAEEIDRGEGIDHEEVKHRLARWFYEWRAPSAEPIAQSFQVFTPLSEVPSVWRAFTLTVCGSFGVMPSSWVNVRL